MGLVVVAVSISGVLIFLRKQKARRALDAKAAAQLQHPEFRAPGGATTRH